MKISWLASSPANLLLEERGEELLPEAGEFWNNNLSAEKAARGYRLNLMKYLSYVRGSWARNIEIFKKVIRREEYDLVIGDETYELNSLVAENPGLEGMPFVMIYDFIGVDGISKNPLEKLKIYLMNRKWVSKSKKFPESRAMRLFIGELEDIPDKPFGFLLPNRRGWAEKRYHFLGYILLFDPAEYTDKAKIRSQIGYGEEPRIVCSMGGTSVGKELLALCVQAYPILRRKIQNLHMLLACGPRFPLSSLEVPGGVEVRGYVPDLYKHFAASDLAIVQGGGTSTLELTALQRPFLYFPLEDHFEQQLHVAGRLARHRAGVKMVYSQTTAGSLAEAVISNFGKRVNYAPIPCTGAQKGAELIGQLL